MQDLTLETKLDLAEIQLMEIRRMIAELDLKMIRFANEFGVKNG